MIRFLRLLSVLFTLTLVVHAVPPLHRLYTMQQSDGTTVQVYVNGNGRFAFYTTIDNQIALRNKAGDICHAMVQDGKLVASDILAHDPALRSAAEIAYIESRQIPKEVITNALLPPRQVQNRIMSASTGNGLGKYGKPGMGGVCSIGEYTIPVIMVQFSDKEFQKTTTVEKMTRFYNEEGYAEETLCVGSVRDYFRDQSRGMFVPTFDVVGIVTLPKTYAHYGSDEDGRDHNLGAFLDDAVTAAVNDLQIDFSQYVVTTTNGGGTTTTGVPLVCLLYAGYGQATGSPDSDVSDTIWPCEWECNKNIKGVHFNSVFVGNELNYNDALMGMGVFVHEFGHALGLPDFYCTDYSYTNNSPCGNWSIMDSGPYVNDARAPIGYNAYEKSFLGWLDIPEIKEPADILLGEYENTSDTSAVLIKNNTTEYFILENRQPGKWYPRSHGSGILLLRVAYNQAAWRYNTVNNTEDKQRVKVITASGSRIMSNALPAHLWGNAKTEILSLPLYSGNELTNAPITDIQKIGSKISFAFKGGAFNPEDEPDPSLGEGKETFDFTKEEAYGMTLLSGNDTTFEPTPVICKEGNVTLKLGSGDKEIRWWAASTGNQLRMYDSATATFTVPDTLAMVKITIKGASRSKFSFTSSPDSISVNDVIATWEGNARTVTVTHSGSGNAQIKSIVVRTLKVDKPTISPFDINGDGAIDVGDITALVGYILHGEQTMTLDVNEDGTVDVGDVTTLVNFILQQ